MFEFEQHAAEKDITIIPKIGKENLGLGSARYSPRSAEITDLIVDPMKRNHGIGATMLQRMEDWALALGAEQITMTVAREPRELEVGGRRDLLNFLRNRGYVLSSPGEVQKDLRPK